MFPMIRSVLSNAKLRVFIQISRSNEHRKWKCEWFIHVLWTNSCFWGVFIEFKILIFFSFLFDWLCEEIFLLEAHFELHLGLFFYNFVTCINLTCHTKLIIKWNTSQNYSQFFNNKTFIHSVSKVPRPT